MCESIIERDDVVRGGGRENESARLRGTTATSERETMRERGITTQGEGVHEGEDVMKREATAPSTSSW